MTEQQAQLQEIYTRLHFAVCDAERACGQINELKKQVETLNKTLKEAEKQASIFAGGGK